MPLTHCVRLATSAIRAAHATAFAMPSTRQISAARARMLHRLPRTGHLQSHRRHQCDGDGRSIVPNAHAMRPGTGARLNSNLPATICCAEWPASGVFDRTRSRLARFHIDGLAQFDSWNPIQAAASTRDRLKNGHSDAANADDLGVVGLGPRLRFTTICAAISIRGHGR
jgi:hypothetical protein